MKFATKILLALSVTVAASAAALAFIAGNSATRLLEGQLVARLEDHANHLLEKVDGYLNGRYFEAKSIITDPEFTAVATSRDGMLRYLAEFLRWHPEFLTATYATPDRLVVANTAGQVAGEREDSADCWAEIAAGNDVAVCVQRSFPEDKPTLRLAVVARDARAARGVVVLRLPLQLLEDQLRQPAGAGSSDRSVHLDLVDKKGVVLYSSYEPERVLRAASPDWDAIQEQVRAGQTVGFLRFTNPAEKIGEEILVYVRERGFQAFPGSGWFLNLFVPTREIFAPVRELRLGIAGAALATGAVLLACVFLFVRSFTRPIEELGRVAREIGRGNLDVRVQAGSRDELGLFAETFNRMAADIRESQRALTTINRELESKVEERTAELLHTNVLLHAELSERVKTQEALAAREHLLRLNADIGETLALDDALPAVLQRCAGHVVRDLDVAFVRIWTSGDEDGVLVLKASAGLYTRLDGQHSRKTFGKLKIGIIAQQQQPLLTNAVIGDPAITDQEWARREGMAAFAGHPLVVDGRTVGVMALFSRRPLEPFVLVALGTIADKLAAFIRRKQAEAALQASEQRYRDLVESSSDGIYKTDSAGIFTNLNPAGARIFGHATPADVIGKPTLDYLRDPADGAALLEKLNREKSVSAYPIRAKKPDGEFVELEASSRILEDENGIFLGIEGVVRDVTARVKAEAERELLIAQLQEAAANIKTLSGLLPICAGCKKIRDDQGSWSQIESYISAHSEAEFSHGLCPECRKVYFPGFGLPAAGTDRTG